MSDGRPIGVVVVTFNSANAIGGLLESLPDGMAGCKWELVVVDNGSADDTVASVRARAAGAAVIELGRNVGYAAALNRGIAAIDPSAHLLALNPDTRLKPSSAFRLRLLLGTPDPMGGGLEQTATTPTVGIAAPLLVDAAGTPAPSLRREPTTRRALAEALFGVRRAGHRGWGEAVLDPAAYERRTVADWASGAALLISRECIDACGPWDESFFLYSEDTEYALRAWERGFVTALEPNAVVVHLGGSSRTDPELWTRLVLNKVSLYRRRHGRLRAFGFRLASLVRELRLALTGHRPSWTASAALVRGWERQ